MENKINNSFWVSGEYSFWLIENQIDRPINVNIRNAERLNFTFTGEEWAQLFYNVLNCPTVNDHPQMPNEDRKFWQKRYDEKFKQSLSTYPMLSELNDIYSKMLFDPKQIRKLMEEITIVMPKASRNKIATQGLKKLYEACKIAVEKEKILYLNGG